MAYDIELKGLFSDRPFMTRFFNIRPYASARHLFFVLVCALAVLAAPPQPRAQILETARVELSDDLSIIPIAPQIYVTEDREKRLNGKIVHSRHQNNLRGARTNSDLLNLGPKPSPVWMVFSVTNNSSRESWVLDFGGVFDGRMGHVKALQIEKPNGGQSQIYFRAGLQGADYNVAGLKGSAFPLRITRGETQQIILYLEMDSTLSNTLRPALMSYDTYMSSLMTGSPVSILFSVFIIALAGFFLALSLMEKTRTYAYISAYFAAFFLFYQVLQNSFLIPHSTHAALMTSLFILPTLIAHALTRRFFRLYEGDDTPNTLLLMSGIFVLTSVIFMLFLDRDHTSTDEFLLFITNLIGMGVCTVIAFTQSQSGKHGGIYMTLAWLCGFIGMAALFFGATQWFGSGQTMIRLYWFMLIPQAGLMIIAAKKKVELDNEEQLSMMARESRTAQSLARLKQSKESADQARLLRVIERERELMAELREREMQRTEEMRRAKEMADEANRAKSAFLAVISHEIRTPMNGIMGMLRLLMDSKMTKQQTEYIQAVQKSGDTMMALLNDILDFEKIESGNMDIENIDFDMVKLVEGVVTLMSGHVAEKGITLRADIGEHFPGSLKGDPTRLRQVLLNLVSNAIKFTTSGGVTIHLKATPVDKRNAKTKADFEIYCAVEDTGIGISEDAQKTLFNPFRQADKSTSRKYGGTGLGLAICRRLIEAMGSTIQVNSEEGTGSTFFFTLWLEEGAKDFDEFAPYGAHEEEAEPVSPMHVLVIDDNELNRRVLKGFLDMDQHTSILCESAEEALDICQHERFDLVITDVRLNGMDGMEFTQHLRDFDNPAIATVPVVALSGNVSDEDQALYREAGMDGFLPKPVNLNSLRKILQDISNDKKPALQKIVAQKQSGTMAAPHAVNLSQADEAFDSFSMDEDNAVAQENNNTSDAEFSSINPEMLQGLAEALPKAQLEELVQSCLDKNEELVEAITLHAPEGDAGFLRERAHELKGMCANFGLSEMSALGATIEKSTKAGDIESVRSEIEQLADAHQRAVREIKIWLSSL